MFPQVFEINLDQDSTRFIAGQVITGRVVLVLNKEKAVKGSQKVLFQLIILIDWSLFAQTLPFHLYFYLN